MKVIFLNIDGVLNRLGTPTEGRTTTTWNGFIGMEPELVARFNKLVGKNTGLQVVLSSTWRLSKTWREDMKGNGLDMEFLDKTDSLYDPKTGSRERGFEIAKWLNEHPEVDKYIIIDDDNDMLPGQNFIQTSFATGLTEEISKSIEQHFK